MNTQNLDGWKWAALGLVVFLISLGLGGCSQKAVPLPDTGLAASQVTATAGAPTLSAPPEQTTAPLPATPEPSPEPVLVEATQVETVVSTVTPAKSGDVPTENAAQADPAGWDLGEGRPEPNNPAFTVYDLTDAQLQMVLEPIRAFYRGMYYTDRLLSMEEASEMIDVDSPAWTDPEYGFQASYDSFAAVGYYPRHEYPIDSSDYFTEWRITPYRSPEGEFYVVVSFRMEEQGFTVYEQATGNVVVTTPYWGPRQVMFHTAYREGAWKIIFRYEEDLGTRMTPTPAP